MLSTDEFQEVAQKMARVKKQRTTLKYLRVGSCPDRTIYPITPDVIPFDIQKEAQEAARKVLEAYIHKGVKEIREVVSDFCE